MEEEKYNPGRNQINQADNDKVRPIKSRHTQKKKHKDEEGRGEAEKRRERRTEKESRDAREITSCSEGDVTIKGNRVIHRPTGRAFPLQQEGR